MLRLYINSQANKTSAEKTTTEISIKTDYPKEIHESTYIETKGINQTKWKTKLLNCTGNYTPCAKHNKKNKDYKETTPQHR